MQNIIHTEYVTNADTRRGNVMQEQDYVLLCVGFVDTQKRKLKIVQVDGNGRLIVICCQVLWYKTTKKQIVLHMYLCILLINNSATWERYMCSGSGLGMGNVGIPCMYVYV